MAEIKDVQMLKDEARHDFHSLISIMALLRSEGGCPWDREQTHESIRSNLIEETYEVVEAIDNRDPSLMQEELGDLLLQVVFHARIAEEAGEFSMDHVVHDISEKLIRRHPHIFADVQADTSDEVLANWEQIKTEEKHRVGLAGSVEAIPPALPALMRMQKIAKKAAKADFVPGEGVAEQALSHAAAAIADGSGDLTENIAAALTALSLIAQRNGADAEEILSHKCGDIVSGIRENEAKVDTLTDCETQKRSEIVNNVFFSHKKAN